MKKMLYQQLTDYLLRILPSNYRSKFYSEMEQGQLLNQGKQVTVDGMELAYISYTAVLTFEELPFKKIDPLLLMSVISIWLSEITESEKYYNVFEYDEVNFDLQLIDDDTADLVFSINFKEPITLMFAEQGNLTLNGENYQLRDIEINIAEHFDLAIGIEND